MGPRAADADASRPARVRAEAGNAPLAVVPRLVFVGKTVPSLRGLPPGQLAGQSSDAPPRRMLRLHVEPCVVPGAHCPSCFAGCMLQRRRFYCIANSNRVHGLLQLCMVHVACHAVSWMGFGVTESCARRSQDEDCSAAKKTGSSDCLHCTLAHLVDLQTAGCTQDAIIDYCNF